jgi:pyrroline-5-carboxylate reductase
MNKIGTERIAFIGGGNMAQALIAGLLRRGVSPRQLCVGEPQPAARARLESEFGVRATPDNDLALDGAAAAVLAIKPQTAAPVLTALRAALLAHRPVLLSIVAGLRLVDLARLVSADFAVVRAMPNRGVLVGAGVTGLYAGASVTAAQRLLAEQIAAAAGRIVWLRAEAELDIVTALSGSGPAYFFLLAEQLAQAATALGLGHEVALLLATETLYGSGILAHADAGLAQQRAAVTSKGGTTEAALAALEAGGFGALIERALKAGVARSAALAELSAPAPTANAQGS